MRDQCGTWRVRTLVLQGVKEFDPTTAWRGHFELQSSPQQMGRSHTSPRVTSAKNANQCDPRASADAESARNDLPRAPCPQDILKVRPPNSLDYRARYNTPAFQQPLLYRLLMKKLFFAGLAFYGLDRPLLAFAGLYWPNLALIEFFGQFEVFLVKKCIKSDHFHYSNIKKNFRTKF